MSHKQFILPAILCLLQANFFVSNSLASDNNSKITGTWSGDGYWAINVTPNTTTTTIYARTNKNNNDVLLILDNKTGWWFSKKKAAPSSDIQKKELTNRLSIYTTAINCGHTASIEDFDGTVRTKESDAKIVLTNTETGRKTVLGAKEIGGGNNNPQFKPIGVAPIDNCDFLIVHSFGAIRVKSDGNFISNLLQPIN